MCIRDRQFTSFNLAQKELTKGLFVDKAFIFIEFIFIANIIYSEYLQEHSLPYPNIDLLD